MEGGRFSEELDKENRIQHTQSDMPRWGLHTSASNPTWQIANGLSPWSCATWSRKRTSECASTTPFSVGSYLQDTGQTRTRWLWECMSHSADLMVMVSSISSTPSRNRFAKTGGTASTTDALTERNSLSAFSLPFPLCLGALLGEDSGFMGGPPVFCCGYVSIFSGSGSIAPRPTGPRMF